MTDPIGESNDMVKEMDEAKARDIVAEWGAWEKSGGHDVWGTANEHLTPKSELQERYRAEWFLSGIDYRKSQEPTALSETREIMERQIVKLREKDAEIAELNRELVYRLKLLKERSIEADEYEATIKRLKEELDSLRQLKNSWAEASVEGQKEIRRLKSELEVNGAMLAKQTDLARVAEEQARGWMDQHEKMAETLTITSAEYEKRLAEREQENP